MEGNVMENIRNFILGFAVCLTFVFAMEHFRLWTPWHVGNMRAERVKELMERERLKEGIRLYSRGVR